MKISIRVISDSSEILEIEGVWNTLVNKCHKNPMFLSGFVKQFMDFNRSEGWTPLVLLISADNMVVCIAPLMMKSNSGVRFVRFLCRSWFSPDFIVDHRYREPCVSHIVDFLFRSLRCQFVELALPAESPSVRILKQKCEASSIFFCTNPEMGHCIIPIRCTWNEFRRLRGSNFRRRFRRLERNLDRAGSWRITCVEDGNEGSDAIKRIVDVERMTWKEEWRALRGKRDEELSMILSGSQYMARVEPDFKWNVWFLELNDQTLAYSLVLQYKEVAFIIKTSYDKRYKRFFPGIYVNNAAIHGLFNKSQLRNIDWLTDLPFHRNWTSTCLPRVRVVMWRKAIIPTIIGFVLANAYTKKILNVIQDPLLLRTYLFS